jgi:hypothetical protein
MKKLMLRLPVLMVAIGILTFSSCKKETTKVATADDSVSAIDNIAVSGAINNTSDVAASIAGNVYKFQGAGEVAPNAEVLTRVHDLLCGITVTENGNVKTITFDGSVECHGFVRSGSITEVLSGAPLWQDAGAMLTITWNHVRVTNVRTQEYYELDGSHTVTNETGGLAWRILAGLDRNQTVTHRNQSASGINISFSNGMKAIWYVDRSRSWASAPLSGLNHITITTFSENTEKRDGWGVNRFGNEFTNSIASPILADNNPDCMYEPYSGEFIHMVANRTTTIVFGTDATGKPIGTATECGLGYFITYMFNGKTVTRFVPYDRDRDS